MSTFEADDDRPKVSRTRFVNCRILQPDGTLSWADVCVSVAGGGGTIEAIHPRPPSLPETENGDDEGEGEDGKKSAACRECDGRTNDGGAGGIGGEGQEVVDCKGGILSPGFIDLQLNGAFGVDFSDRNVSSDSIHAVADRLPEHGVTSFCPTLVSCPPGTYRTVIPTLSRLCLPSRRHSTVRSNATRRDREGVASSGRDGENGASGAEKFRGANLLGLHLEGPFFARPRRGAHDEECIRTPTDGMKSLTEMYGDGAFTATGVDGATEEVTVDNGCQPAAVGGGGGGGGGATGGVCIVTLAPELPGALDAIAALSGMGIVAAMGHSDASLEDGVCAVRAGATLVTHLYNAMGFHHRDPGLVGLALGAAEGGDGGGGAKTGGGEMDGAESPLPGAVPRRPYFSIIADGVHCHPAAVRMAYLANPDGLVLVTDAMAAMGLGDGVHSLGTTRVSVVGKRATIADTDTFAGSVVSMDMCVRGLRNFTGCSIGSALLAATLRPAKVLGCESIRGTIAVGAVADLVLLDDGMNVLKTWVGSQNVYNGGVNTGNKRKLDAS